MTQPKQDSQPRAPGVPCLTLNDGRRMPQLGLGTWQAGGQELVEAVKAAVRAGYRHVDTAANYGNERQVGEALRGCIDEGLVRREDLFVTTKLWNNSHRRESVPVALRKSLAALQLDRVDLYLVHYPVGYREGEELSPKDASGGTATSLVDYLETWRGMEDCQRLGLASSIGVSNFNSHQLARLLRSCCVTPAVNQVESHPYLSQDRLIEFCQRRGVALTAYCPLGSPGRRDPGEPRLLEDPLVRRLAEKYGRPAAVVLIRFQLQRGLATIPKAVQAAHIRSNLEAIALELAPVDVAALSALNRNYRYVRLEQCRNHPFYPFGADY